MGYCRWCIKDNNSVTVLTLRNLSLLRYRKEKPIGDKIKKFIKENAVDEGFLQDWYQNSVLETDTPVWTDEHIAEMIGDFYLIPKEVVDGREN